MPNIISFFDRRRSVGFMAKQDMIEIDGIVVDTLPNAAFKVKLENLFATSAV